MQAAPPLSPSEAYLLSSLPEQPLLPEQEALSPSVPLQPDFSLSWPLHSDFSTEVLPLQPLLPLQEPLSCSPANAGPAASKPAVSNPASAAEASLVVFIYFSIEFNRYVTFVLLSITNHRFVGMLRMVTCRRKKITSAAKSAQEARPEQQKRCWECSAR